MSIRKNPASAWKTDRGATLRHIHISPFRDGWTVGEVALANAQFFHSRNHAEAAARALGERLSGAGDPSRISIWLADGASGGQFIAKGDNLEGL